MKYTVFHREYSDVAPHFDRMGQMLGLYEEEGESAPVSGPGGSLGGTPSPRGPKAGVEK